MPEAAVNEYNRTVLRQDDIRLSWQISAMKAEAEPHAVQHGTDNQLRLGVRTRDPAHIPTASLRRQVIHRQVYVSFERRRSCTIRAI